MKKKPRKNQGKVANINKVHSAVCSDETNEESEAKDQDNFKYLPHNDYSSDEEQKILDEISDNENDISFNLDDEDFDIFCERSETIYSKKDKFENVKAKDFALKKLIRTTDMGKVYLAEYKDDKNLYALKSIKRDKFIRRFKSINVLKDLSDQLDHPFI